MTEEKKDDPGFELGNTKAKNCHFIVLPLFWIFYILRE